MQNCRNNGTRKGLDHDQKMLQVKIYVLLIMVLFFDVGQTASSKRTVTNSKNKDAPLFDNLHPRWIYLTGGDDAAWIQEKQPGPRSRAAGWTDHLGNLWAFGGIGIDSELSTGAHLTNDLWYLDVATMNWTQKFKPQLNNSKSVPVIRRGSVACGVKDIVLIVYGGQTLHDQLLGDTWVFNVKKGQWIHLDDVPKQPKSSGVRPPPRISPVSWCLRDKLIVFGGLGENGVIHDDMWVFSMRTLSWKEVHVDKEISTTPAGRTGATSWITANKLYMFGGASSNPNPDKILQSDLWEYSLDQDMWSNLHRGYMEDSSSIVNSGPSPEPRKYAQGWYEPIGGNLYLFGGEGHPDTHVLSHKPTLFDELWAYNIKSGQWNNLLYFTAALKQSRRTLTAETVRTRGLTWTGPSNTFYMFGGVAYDRKGQLNLLNDVWTLVPPNVPLPSHIKETSLEILKYPKTAPSPQSDPTFIFLMCLLTIGGVVLVVGAFFFLKKMSDYPRHRARSRNYNAKYAKLDLSDDPEDAAEFLQIRESSYDRKSSSRQVSS